jgi:hypothetical protein
MLSTTKTISLNGTSTVQVDGKDVVAMTMNASINENGSFSVNKFIQNKEVYLANKEKVDTDYTAFETYANGLLEV